LERLVAGDGTGLVWLRIVERFSQRGGVNVGGWYASWPFGKIVVESGVVRLGAMGCTITLTPGDIVSIHTTWRRVIFEYRTSMLAQSVNFETLRQSSLIGALREAGFKVQDGGDGFTRFSS
jgi:hypothetical protein